MEYMEGLWGTWRGYGVHGGVMGYMEGLWSAWRGFGVHARVMKDYNVQEGVI